MNNYIVGHKIPDSDSICSAISLSYLLSKINKDEVYIPVRQGDISKETQFILDKFEFKIPDLKTSFKNEKTYLVDHSDLRLAPDDILEAKVLGIIDHHKLGDITTNEPLECWIKPVGCTATIIHHMFFFYDIDIPANIAGLMLSAILSDTVIFKSPTCTTADIKVVEELSKIANIDDIYSFGIEIFKHKSDINNSSINNLILRDFKDFNINNNLVAVSQLELIDNSLIEDIKQDLMIEMIKAKNEKGFHSFILLITDIMKEGSDVLVISDSYHSIEAAFDIAVIDNHFWKDGLMSRKKQVIPLLEKFIK